MNQVKLGIRENWKQFFLLVLINAFVGGMVGMERSILPQLAEEEFQMAAKTAILSFIIVFGISKAITNYFTGAFANKVGRKNLLTIGWLFALPVPFIIIYAPNWSWIIIANILLGINQGLTWSSTVVMKIDLVGSKNRGLAMGFNEAAGYLAVGAVALASGYLASNFGLRPYPFYIGIFLSFLGLLSSWILVQDTIIHVGIESNSNETARLRNVFLDTSWRHPNLGSITQAGLVNNLNDGMIWGLFPILLANKGFELEQIAQIVAIYPMVWGIAQLGTGKLADMLPKKPLLFWGMLLQGLAIIFMVFASNFNIFVLLSVILGLGTAIVYPTFLAAIADETHPEQRPKSIGVFRLWRDLGYAIGALITGIIADLWDTNYSVLSIAFITLLSSFVIQVRMKKQMQR